MSLHAKPTQRRVDDKYLDKHSQRHNKSCESSAIAEYYHNRKSGLEKGKNHECRPTATEEKSGVSRQHKVVGLQFVDNVQRDKRSCKETQKEYCTVDKTIVTQYFEKLFHHSDLSSRKNYAK